MVEISRRAFVEAGALLAAAAGARRRRPTGHARPTCA